MIYSKKFYALKETTYFYRTSHKKTKWNKKMIMDQLNGFEDCIHYSKIYKLDNLYCEVIKNLNMDLFLTPIGKFRKNKQLIKKVSQIIKNINFYKLNSQSCLFKLNKQYNTILKL